MSRKHLLEDIDFLRMLVEDPGLYQSMRPKEKQIIVNYVSRAIDKFRTIFGQI